MDHLTTELEQALRRRGLRLTGPRKRVAEKLLSLPGHVDAEELEGLLKKEGRPVSRATIYRTLSLLQECGLFESHDFGNGRKVYERAVGRAHHDHLYCIVCGAIYEFVDEKIEWLQDQVTKKYNFTPVYHSHKIFGYCSKCARGGKKQGGERT